MRFDRSTKRDLWRIAFLVSALVATLWLMRSCGRLGGELFHILDGTADAGAGPGQGG